MLYSAKSRREQHVGMKHPENLNVPNALTVIRLLLIPVFCCLMWRGSEMAALVVFLFAGFTDLVDGFIARRFNQITDFGKLMDPLADKIMVLSVMIMLVLNGIAPAAAVIVLLIKELIMILGGIYALRVKKVVVFSRPIGKMAQLVTFLGLVLCFFHRHFAAPILPWHLIVLWTGMGLALIALVFYARAFLAILKKAT